MAHSTLHFSLGWMAGTAFAAPALLRAWISGRRLSPHFRRWFLASYLSGIYAVTPGILRRIGVPDGICDGWWMNVFVLYPLVNAWKSGAVTMGPLVLGACLGIQYVALVAAVRRALRGIRPACPESD